MRVPSYRRHSSGQARVTINGRDHLLGKYGTPESKEKYGRLIAEFNAANRSATFGLQAVVAMEDLVLAYLLHSKEYYGQSTEHANMKPVLRSLDRLYASLPASEFGPAQFKVVRQSWIDEGKNSRQTINKQMARLRRALKWAVAEGYLPASNFEAIKCVEPLKKGRVSVPESPGVKPVSLKLVSKTLAFLTPVLSSMVEFQQVTGCRPGEVCKITPGMVDRSGSVWLIKLEKHKMAHQDRERTIYCGPKAQAVLAPYLLRAQDAPCFSPRESEEQRRRAVHLARKCASNQGNRPGYSAVSRLGRKPRSQPGEAWTTGTYSRAVRNACKRAEVDVWSPGQLRHTVATDIRKRFGVEAAQVILGHADMETTQIYAEADRDKAIKIARRIG